MSSLMLGVLDGMMQQPTLMTYLESRSCLLTIVSFYFGLVAYFCGTAILTWKKATSFFAAKMNRKSAVNVRKVP